MSHEYELPSLPGIKLLDVAGMLRDYERDLGIAPATEEFMEVNVSEQVRQKERRGFAVISVERRREIASLGGRTAHLRGTAHQWTSAEAAAAGRKGGLAKGRGGKGKAEVGKESAA